MREVEAFFSWHRSFHGVNPGEIGTIIRPWYSDNNCGGTSATTSNTCKSSCTCSLPCLNVRTGINAHTMKNKKLETIQQFDSHERRETVKGKKIVYLSIRMFMGGKNYIQ